MAFRKKSNNKLRIKLSKKFQGMRNIAHLYINISILFIYLRAIIEKRKLKSIMCLLNFHNCYKLHARRDTISHAVN